MYASGIPARPAGHLPLPRPKVAGTAHTQRTAEGSGHQGAAADVETAVPLRPGKRRVHVQHAQQRSVRYVNMLETTPGVRQCWAAIGQRWDIITENR